MPGGNHGLRTEGIQSQGDFYTAFIPEQWIYFGYLYPGRDYGAGETVEPCCAA